MAYGDVSDVEALAALWTHNGHFTDPDMYDEGTNPTRAQVIEWISQISDQMDLSLANAWFVVPVVQASNGQVHSILSQRVTHLVADLCGCVNATGQLFTISQRGADPLSVTLDGISTWVRKHADGFVGLGLEQRQRTAKQSAAFFDVL